MSLNSEQQLINTRVKLARLEKRYQQLGSETTDDEELREMTMESLQRTINQFKEEIARYETSQPARRKLVFSRTDCKSRIPSHR